MPSESGGNPERVPPLVAAGVLLQGFAATLPPGGARGVSLLTNALTLVIAAMILREALARVRRGREAGARLVLRPQSFGLASDAGADEAGYADVYSIEAYGLRRTRGIVVTLASTRRHVLPDDGFTEDGASERFREALWGRVRLLPGGDARALRMRQRAAVGERVGRALPCASLGVALGIVGLFALLQPIGVSDEALRGLGARSGAAMFAGDVRMLVTGALLHASWPHVASNALGLVLLGTQVENVLGRARWVLVLGASSVVGTLLSAALFPEMWSVGASGGVIGGLGALLYLNLARRDELSARHRYAFSVLAVFSLSALAGGLMPEIDGTLHAGGLLGGVAACALVVRGKPLHTLAQPAPGAVTLAARATATAYALGAASVALAAARSLALAAG